MNIWDILQIEATSDKKAIKKAYARRSKVVHPEEKPEEFQQLYAAYQAALNYVDHGAEKEGEAVDERIEEKKTASQPATVPQEFQELAEFFLKKQKHKEECLEAFQQAFDAMKKKHWYKGVRETWKEYLESKEFKEIWMDSKVINILIDEIPKVKIYEDEFCLILWEAYHFQEEGENSNYSEVSELRNRLYPAALRHSKQMEKDRRKEEERLKRRKQEEEHQLKMEYQRKEISRILRVAALIVCVVIPIYLYYTATADRRYIQSYMAVQYPGTKFSNPEAKERGTDPTLYVFHSLDEPELIITASAKENDRDDREKPYDVVEDYGAQMLQKIAEGYGLKCGYTIDYIHQDKDIDLISVFYYPNIEEIGQFCKKFSEFMEIERENIKPFLKYVSFCGEDFLYPQMMLGKEGGELINPVIYFYNQLLNKTELAESILKSGIQYMYHYEAWNLTLEQQDRYGADYIAEELLRYKKRYKGRPEPVGADAADVGVTARAKQIYLPVWTCWEYSDMLRHQVNYLAVGDAYQYLRAREVEVEVYPDGSGFFVYSQNKIISYGVEAVVELEAVYRVGELEGISLYY